MARTFSILGYSLLPIVILSGIAVVYDLRGVPGEAARSWEPPPPSRCAHPPAVVVAHTHTHTCVLGARHPSVVAGAVLGLSAVLWCTQSATRFFEGALHMREQRYLIAFPTFLLYACFALMTIF